MSGARHSLEEVKRTLELLDPRELLKSSVLELRGDGKAGGGLVLAFQSLGNLFLRDPGTYVQEWPFFGSARRGANIRSFLRVSHSPAMAACEVTRPSLALLMNEGAAHAVDFAQGVPHGGTFVLNTRRSPEECARHFKLSGRVFTVPGDDIGLERLKASIGNVSAFVAVAEAVGGFPREDVVDSFMSMLEKRRVPEAVLARNKEALLASFEAVRHGVFEFAGPTDHAGQAFQGYGDVPIGAQTPLRLSASNRTASFAPSGFRLKFEDPDNLCDGCSSCVVYCPEGIILYVPDSRHGIKVTGAEVNQFCKLCGECIAVCPHHLFKSVPYEEQWAEEVKVS